MVKIIGIDPGINGGCALYDSEGAEPTVLNGIFDMPTIGESAQREIDYGALRDLIFAVRPDVAVIEIVNAFMPTRENSAGETEKVQWGGTSLFRFGGAYFATHAVVACLNIPRVRVSSAKWKNHFGLKGKKKGGGTDDSARQVVLRRFPSLQPLMNYKHRQHVAEAFLMAVWYAEDGIKPQRKTRRRRVGERQTMLFDHEESAGGPADWDAEEIPE